MENKNSKARNNDSLKRNEKSNLKNSEQHNLKFNKVTNSYELDVNAIEDNAYNHPDPYDTEAKNGADMNSDYDEANPYVGNIEYDKHASLETDIENLAMHKIKATDLLLNAKDKMLCRTPEDFRDDLDEEGYPKNDFH